MGLISRLLNYARTARHGAQISDIQHDSGGGPLSVGEHFQTANTDSVPLPGDYVVALSVQRSGGAVIVGFIDPKQQQAAQPGEHRTYARDAGGAEVVQMFLKANGDAVLSNDAGSVTLHASGRVIAQNGGGFIDLTAGGTVNINGATIDPTGAIVSPVSVTAPVVNGTSSVLASGKELVDHLHPAGTPPGNTGANI